MTIIKVHNNYSAITTRAMQHYVFCVTRAIIQTTQLDSVHQRLIEITR